MYIERYSTLTPRLTVFFCVLLERRVIHPSLFRPHGGAAAGVRRCGERGRTLPKLRLWGFDGLGQQGPIINTLHRGALDDRPLVLGPGTPEHGSHDLKCLTLI